MGFIARIDEKGLHGVLTCEASGGSQEIGFDAALRASAVAVPLQGDTPSPILFACGASCGDALLASGGAEAGADDFQDWWEAMAVSFGFDDNADDALAPETFWQALGELEDAVQHLEMPAGLTVGEALSTGTLDLSDVERTTRPELVEITEEE